MAVVEEIASNEFLLLYAQAVLEAMHDFQVRELPVALWGAASVLACVLDANGAAGVCRPAAPWLGQCLPPTLQQGVALAVWLAA